MMAESHIMKIPPRQTKSTPPASGPKESHIMKIPPRDPNKPRTGNTEGILVNEPAKNAPGNSTNPPVPKLTVWSFLGKVFKVGWDQTKEYVHTALDAAGSLPVVGSVFDGINGAIYAAEGDAVNAAVSFASAGADLIPGVGTAAKAAKWGYKAGTAIARGAAKGAVRAAEKAGIRQVEKAAIKGAERQSLKSLEKGAVKTAEKDTAKAAEKGTAKKAEKEAGPTQNKAEKKEDGIQTKDKQENKASKNKVCPKAGHPVNPILGIKFLTDETELDFSLPSPLPLLWQRSYFSDQPGNGWLGQGWSLPFSSRLRRCENTLTFIDSQGREIVLPRLDIGQRRFNRVEQLYFERGENGRYYISTRDGKLRYIFAPLALGEGDRRGENAPYLPLIAMEDIHGNHIRMNYNHNGLPVDMYDAAGRRLKLSFINLSLPSGEQVQRLHRVVQTNNLAGMEHNEVLVTYRYSAEGDLINVQDRAGNISREYRYINHILTGHAQPGGLIAQYEYDQYTPLGRVIRHTTNLGQTWLFDYGERETRVTDPLQRVTRYQFDADKSFTGVIHADGTAITRTLDKYGRLTALVTPCGRKTSWSYDHQGRVNALTDAAGQRTLFRYDMHHRLVAVADVMGHTTYYDYDDSGNMVRETNALGKSAAYDYDARGLLTAVTGTDGKTRRMTYDRMGLPVAYTDCSSQTTRLARDNRGNIKAITHPDGTQALFTHDGQGRMLSVFQADGSGIHNTYDALGRLTAQHDALGAQTQWQRDVDGLPLVRTDAGGQRFYYHYDAARRLVRLTNENGADYHITYDEQDNVLSSRGFDGVLARYRYDEDGLLVEKLEAGVGMALRRDELGRIIEKITRQASAQVHNHYSYDPAGRLIRASNAHSTIEYGYDPLGRLVSEISEVLGCRQALRHSYDSGGGLRQTQLPDGTALNYLRYGPGHLLQLNLDDEIICETERDAMHREISRTQGPLTSHFDYAPLGQLLEQRVTSESFAPALISRSYQYDRAGNLLSVMALSGEKARYSYDLLGRLKQAGKECFTFDPAHNLIDADGARSINNRLSKYKNTHYLYDQRGNLRDKTTKDGSRLRLYWTPEHQLEYIEAERDGTKHTVQYGYDALGRRVYKKGVKGTTLFFWDGSRLLSERNTGQTITYLYGASGFTPLAQVVQREGEQRQINYYHTDHIGTPYALTSQDGRVVWQADYQAWGKRRETRASCDEAIYQPLCYQGQYYDEESGLHYNYHRYYDPDAGRFISPDPIGLAGGENFYQYAPNPTGWIDPLGLVKEHTGFVYRALTDMQLLDGMIGDPILSKNPNANFSHKYHVGGPVAHGGDHLGGSNIETQFISTSKSYDRALCYSNNQPGAIAQIDLSRIDDRNIIDISNGHGLKGSANLWARQDQEVLIVGQIPSGAYRLMSGPPV